jgi:aconitate decarboxylase
MNIDSPTRTLAGFAANLMYSDIPSAVVDRIKLCLLDTIGCGLFGSTLPWGKILAGFTKDLGGPEESTLIGVPHKVTAPNAALANGTMIHGFELDDFHRLAIMHPGSVALPAAMAIGEKKGCNGKELITALVAGYEVAVRIGKSVGASHLRKGYHPTGTHGTFGAAAAAGRMLELDEDKMIHAFGIAGTQAAGLMAAQYASMVKRMHAGRASQSGVYAALLAGRGLTGITDILEVDYGGYCSVMGDSCDLEGISIGLGKQYEVLNGGFKEFSCGGSNLTSLEALSGLMNDHCLNSQQIKNITIRCTTITKLHNGWDYKPEGVTAAQMNMPYCLAVMALESDAFVEQFTPEKMTDPKVLDFIRRIKVIADSELDSLGQDYRHAIICQIETEEGRVLERRIDFAKGGPDNPLTQKDLETKFWKLSTKVFSEQQARELHRTILGIEDVASLDELTCLLVPQTKEPN